MKKICKYDPNHWLMQDENKNLLLMNEQTGMIYDFENIQPERSKREDYKVTTINGNECPKIEMPIDKDILTKYKWNL